MLMIRAVSFNGQPTATQLYAEFGEQGGVIGRANGNALVLPDPERIVSRTHATISFRRDSYVIRDMSSATPVYINGRPLGNGREADLQSGDELRIGAYVLEVQSDGADSPFASGLPALQAAVHAPSFPVRGQGAIPEDFDPFADISPPAAGQRLGPKTGGDFPLGLEPASNSDINQLFGLGPNAADGPFPAGHPLAGAREFAGDAGSVDPLVVLGAMPQAGLAAISQRDDAREIHAAFVPPQVFAGNEQKSRNDFQGARGEPRQGPANAEAMPDDMVLSWKAVAEKEASAIKTMVLRPSAKAQHANAPAREAEPAPAAPVPVAMPAAAAPSGTDAEELLRAFLDGAGVPELDMGGPLTPDMMAMLGQLLRESMQGTLDLLMARALTKREMHAQMTMIASRENNPLKFSPNVEVALHSLLAPRGKGFMPPLQAMRDAYDDLRAHQFGVMAGTRAALGRVLQRFDPVQLEERLIDKTLVDTLLPANRKAKLWSLYLELYTDITREAEDDFQTWFGKEFLTAYEAQMAKLKQDGRPNP